MKLSKELKSRWAVLLLTILCVTLIVHFVYEEIYKPKAYETVNIFVTAESCENVKLGNAVRDKLSVKTTVSGYSLEDKYYKESLQTSGLILADLLVIPQSLLPEKSVDKEFAPLKAENLLKYGINCENYDFYVKDNVNYAVKVYDAETKNNLMEQWAKFDGKEDYYVLINLARPNAAPYSSGKTTTDNAFYALAILLGI